MSRKPRKLSPTNIYHVVIRGADRQIIFNESNDYKKYLEIIELYKYECGFELFAYCLMSNHVHLLVRINNGSLSTIFQRINTRYAQWFNMKYSRTGFLQQGRFYSEPVCDTRYFLIVLCYIHHNPLSAGLEKELGTYKWSSFFAYIKEEPSIVDTNLAINEAGGVSNLLNLHMTYDTENTKCLDTDSFSSRLPDDVAQQIIQDISGCINSTEFQKLPMLQKNICIIKINKKGVSIRQLNRLTGTPKGVIENVLKNQACFIENH